MQIQPLTLCAHNDALYVCYYTSCASTCLRHVPCFMQTLLCVVKYANSSDGEDHQHTHCASGRCLYAQIQPTKPSEYGRGNKPHDHLRVSFLLSHTLDVQCRLLAVHNSYVLNYSQSLPKTMQTISCEYVHKQLQRTILKLF